MSHHLPSILFLAFLVSASVASNRDHPAPQPPTGKPWVYRTYNGSRYACKPSPIDASWPAPAAWHALNASVGGNLHITIPPGAACFTTFQAPLGNVSTYDAEQCAQVTAQWGDEQYQIENPTAGMWTYFTNDTCRPTTYPSDTCTLGYYPALSLTASSVGHIRAGLDFARTHNIRLVVRNTGHDFLGRSVGWGALVINTHNLQEITFHTWHGPTYTGPAVRVGAGVQAYRVLEAGHELSPPQDIVTGECATVGVAGGLVQGGGHGPLTSQHGLLADTALEFTVLTAAGAIVSANAEHHADLFWALRGGGPASYGIVLCATYRTYDDVPSAGMTLDLSSDNATLFWEAVRAFHGRSVYFAQHGVYVYYELGTAGNNLHVHPFLGVGKGAAELHAVIKPLLDELDALGVAYATTTQEFPTFYDLFTTMFEPEVAGNSALTGGWAMARADVENNHPAIIDALQTVLSAGAFVVGHMWDGGRGVPHVRWGDIAINPRFRHVVDKVITIVPVAGIAPLEEKIAAQHKLTYVVDAALRQAAPNGAAYVNEADPFPPNWQDAFWGANYPRLVAIRKKYDPDGVFYAVSTPGTEEWVQIETGTRLCRRIE